MMNSSVVSIIFMTSRLGTNDGGTQCHVPRIRESAAIPIPATVYPVSPRPSYFNDCFTRSPQFF
jgi:hypothetical protein